MAAPAPMPPPRGDAAAPAADMDPGAQAVCDAAGAACAAACAASPDVAAAMLGARVVTITFAPDGGASVDVDGASADVPASALGMGDDAAAEPDGDEAAAPA